MIMVRAGDNPCPRKAAARSAMPTRTFRAISTPSMIFAVMPYGLSDLTELRHGLHEAELDLISVARRQHARNLFLPDLNLDECRSVARMQQASRGVQFVNFRYRAHLTKSAGFGDAGHVDAVLRVARLHAGLAVMPVVQDEDR